jgi:tetratricopeptide (TPR) repeat protein
MPRFGTGIGCLLAASVTLVAYAAGADVATTTADASRLAQAYKLYSLAQQSILERDYSQAVDLMERAAARDASPGLLLELGQLHFSLNDLDKAFDLGKRILAMQPELPAAHKLLGDVYLGRAKAGTDTEANIARAMDEYRAARRADPADEESARTLAELLYHTGRVEEAADLLTGFAQTRSLDPALSLLLGKALIRAGRFDEAEKILSGIIARSPKNLEAADALGALYEYTKEYDKAIAVYAPFLKESTQKGYLHVRIGSLHLQAKRYTEAIEELAEAQRIDPDDARGLLALAEAYEGATRFDAAVGCYDHLIDREPGNLEARFHRARLKEKQGEHTDALAGFKSIIELATGRGAITDREASVLALAYSRIGLIEMESRHFEPAATAFLQALNATQDPGPELFFLLGRAEIEARETKGAEHAVLEGIRRHPTDLALQVLKGEVLIASGDLNGARAFYATLIEEREHAPETYIQVAETFLRQKRYQDADDLLNDAVRRHPEDDALLFTRGAAMEHLGRIGDAERLLAKAITINPSNAMALNYLGYMLADRGLKLKESVVYVKRALEIDPDNAAYLDSLGWAQFKLSLFTPAEENLRAAVKHDGSDPTIREHLGDLLAATGRPEEAVREWEQALDRGHDAPEKVRGKISSARASLKASQ